MGQYWSHAPTFPRAQDEDDQNICLTAGAISGGLSVLRHHTVMVRSRSLKAVTDPKAKATCFEKVKLRFTWF